MDGPASTTTQVPSAPKPIESWRVNNFDLIRLLAALQVAIVHAITHLHPPGLLVNLVNFSLRLFPGVPIFFVVSGFLISKSFENSNSLRDYCRNRCLRIFPGLWVCLVVTVGIMLVVGVGTVGMLPTRDWLLWWAAQMTLVQSYSPGFEWPPGGVPNVSLWTIPLELEFYLLLPALYAWFGLRRRRGNLSLVVVLLASLAVHVDLVYFHHQTPIPIGYVYLAFTVMPYLWMFLVGVLIQRNWSKLRSVLEGRAHWWLVGYLLLCGVATGLGFSVGSNTISPTFLFPLAGLVISAATTAPGIANKLLHHQDISYGTYVYHAPVINFMVSFGFVGSIFSVIGTIATALTLALVSWVLVEKPFLRHKHNALQRAAA